MKTSLDNLELGREYKRDDRAIEWGLKNRHAIRRGVFTPADDNKIILFISLVVVISSILENHIAIIDLAWPEGLQSGYSQPVALLLNEPTEVEEIVNRAGYKYFKDVESFKNYVRREILAEAPGYA